MLKVILFSDYQFNNEDKASTLLKFLSKSIFPPTRFDTKEPVRKSFVPTKLSEPARLLSGTPQHLSGNLFLKGSKYKFLSWFKWSTSQVSEWYIEIDEKYFTQPKRVEAFIQFIADLCKEFPVIYGGAAHEEDWDAKHWLVEEAEDGESHEKVGLSLEQCLPGIYWFTIFGAPLVRHLGRDKLEALPAHRIIDMGKNGVGVVLRKAPFTIDLAQRLRQETEIMRMLGPQYFFDIDHPDRACQAIPGVTQVEDHEATEPESPISSQAEGLEEFERQNVVSPDGGPYTELEGLAEALVVYLHDVVHEVFTYSRATLTALDAYFSEHPPQQEFKRSFLLAEFIPALGAYLGKVLIRELGCNWNLRVPNMKSTVMCEKREIAPFRAAYRVVYEGNKLLDVYDALVS